uniref:Zinc finger protein 292-like n=1 Tax=Sinocyclocheilus grahami TaxID=75366 RepID=A0A672N541_SINGR
LEPLWRIEEEPLPVLEVYIIALLSFAQASPHLSTQCEAVPVLLERLSLSCAELLLSLPRNIPDALWDRFRSSVQIAHPLVQEKRISNLMILSTIAREQGVWSNPTLQGILTNHMPPQEKGFLTLEGQTLLRMRVKHLIKESRVDQAASLAKACAELSEFEEKGHFKQMFLACLCTAAPQDVVMQELSRVDCRDALEMICNLEADGDEKAAFTLCSGFLTRQILQEDSYCAWQLTLFWGKLLKRLESSEQGFLDRCRQMSFLSKTVFHLLFFIKVIQSEMDKAGLSTCVELCIRALRLESCEGSTKATVCKTISCLLPSDLEVKRACQLTEFLLEPTVDSYYAVETLYNEPDQKLDEEDLPVPNSLRCELLLVLKTQWPFDPEFWNWKALKRHCLGLMGEEASIVSSIDELNDGDPEGLGGETSIFSEEFKEVSQRFVDATNELNEIADQRQKNKELKKLREKGFVSARFRNWQAYMQYCVLCDKEFLGHRIVRHAQTHFKDGRYTCPICIETFETRETLEPHVASHVKLSCKERLAAMKTSKQLANPKTAAPVIAALKAKSSENQVRKTKTKNNSGGQSNKLSNGDANDSECLDFKGGCEGNVCPVHSCRRGFKYFRNLVAHVKDHGDNEEAKRFLEMQSTKVVCQYCRRQFVSVDHLNDHLQMHCGTKPYICIQLNCKASFDSNTELIVHKKNHPVFKAKCMFPGCGKIFHETYKLYDHEAQHYKTFTCKAPDCGKVFHSQSELDLHAEGHVTKVEGQCTDSQSVQPAEPHPDHSDPNDQGCAQIGSLSVTHLNDNGTGSPVDHPSSMASHNATPLVSLGQMLPPVSQTLPLQMASVPNNGQVLENKSVKPVDTNIAQVVKDKERHKCPHESCTRDYSSYRSVTKHMRAVHPDFYTQWKLARKNNAVVKSTLRSVSVNGSHNSVVKPQHQLGQRVPGPSVQTQNPLVQPPLYPNNWHIRTNEMDNILDPIVLSQLGNGTNQPQIAADHLWDPRNNSVLQQQTCHSQSVTQNMNTLPSSHFTHVNAASSDNQTNNESFSAVKLERSGETSLGLPLPNNEIPPSNGSSPSSQSNTGNVSNDGGKKKVKRSRRTKWPAIIKDGKFICRRCFREFQSPKSLGGHLSKRAYCKSFDEADLTADLPSSFLDLLNSPHPTSSSYVNLPQPKGPLDPKLFPNVTFPQANGTYTSNDKHTGGVLKQSPSNLCESSGQELQTVSNLCGPYAQSSRMSETSVIQHTGSVKLQLQASYSDMSDPLYNESVHDPLLSQLLADDQSTSSLNSGFSDHVSQILQAETSNKMKEIKEKTPNSNASDLSNDGLLAAMASLAQNLVSEKSVKERLREQILAGDLHKKSSLPCGSSVDSSCSQMSVASPVSGDPQRISNFIQNASQSEAQPAGNIAEVSVESVSQLDDVSPDDGLIRTISSVFSGSAGNDQPNHTPITREDEVLEIQKALEKLDLDREISEVTRTVASPVVNDEQLNKPESKDLPVELPSYVKPFACDKNGCNYSAMTKDALFKHLVKLHNYTDDMLTQMKDQFNVAPFSCQKCSKSFTRNSNLKAHYLTVHNFSQEDIKKMKIKSRSNHRLPGSDRGSPCPVPEIPNSVKNTQLVNARQQQKHVKCASDSIKKDHVKISRCITPSLVKQSSFVSQGKSLAMGTTTVTPQNQMPFQPSVIVSGCSSVTPKMDQNAKGWFSTKSPDSGPTHVSPLKEILPIAPFPQNPSAPVQTQNQSLDKRPKPPSKPRVAKPRESPKKSKEKKSEADDIFSPYRPYRCVHQGCVAAFTIQHNLILHYKAVHQSELPKFEVNSQDEQNEEEAEDKDRNEESDDKLDMDIKEVDEFRCQVKDCSCIFQSVPDLLQHYLQLHKLTLEKAGAIMCSINLGRFQCDQPDCSETFTAFWKYIGHVDQEHKETQLSKVDPVEGMFRCPMEGCECAYSTRSNLLRHTMKKHQDVYKRLLMNPREGKSGVKLGRPRKYETDIVEKENRETNKKPIKKEAVKKRKVNKNNWTKYGKPLLKTQEEASAMCTKRLQLQYACMIKGCETVTGSERNIMKHYLQHGLPKQYLEEQRSNFIYCKKLPRSRYKRIASRSDDTDNSAESSIETTENEEVAEPGQSESEFSKPTSEKESTEDADLSDGKPSTDTCSEISVVVKRRRGRPRKGERVSDKPLGPKRLTRLRTARSSAVSYVDLNSDSTSSSTTMAQEDASGQNTPLSSFKPMGFEVSFLQFLQESKTSQKRKATVPLNGNACKKMTKAFSAFHLKTATVVCKRSDAQLHSREVLQLVEFKNPQKLTSLSNVTFEVQKVFSCVYEILLKQLHEMRPTSHFVFLSITKTDIYFRHVKIITENKVLISTVSSTLY